MPTPGGAFSSVLTVSIVAAKLDAELLVIVIVWKPLLRSPRETNTSLVGSDVALIVNGSTNPFNDLRIVRQVVASFGSAGRSASSTLMTTILPLSAPPGLRTHGFAPNMLLPGTATIRRLPSEVTARLLILPLSGASIAIDWTT